MVLSLGGTCGFGLIASLVFIGLEAVTSRLDIIDLPDGFFPDSITRGGDDWTAYVGSYEVLRASSTECTAAKQVITMDNPEETSTGSAFAFEGGICAQINQAKTFVNNASYDGSIWKGDLFTGVGEVVLAGVVGNTAPGLDYDPRSGYLFVAGGTSGARIYDAQFGIVAEYDFSGVESSYVNDVLVTDTSAYFTDSFQAKLYAVDLNVTDGLLANGPDLSVRIIALSPEFPNVGGQFNGNGIQATHNGGTLIVANTHAGKLFTVDPASGNATAIDLGGAVISPDGLVLRESTLWIIENGFGGKLHQIQEVSLSPDLSCGFVSPRVLTHELFVNPTSAARKGHSFYVVSSKFSVAAEDRPTTAYEIVRVDRDSGEYVCSAE